LESIPGPRKLPFSNHLIFWPLTKLSDAYLERPRLREKYGPIVKTQVFKEWMVILFDPVSVRKVMNMSVVEADRPGLVLMDEARKSLTQYFGGCKGFSLSNGREFLELKNKFSALAGADNSFKNEVPDQQKTAERLLEILEVARYVTGEIDSDYLLNMLSKWAVEANGKFFMSSPVGTLSNDMRDQTEAQYFVEAVSAAMDAIKSLETGPFLWIINKNLSPNYKKLCKSQADAARIATIYFQREKYLIKQRQSAGTGLEFPKLIERWINDPNITSQEILAVFIDMMGAGVKTTAYGVFSTLQLLGENPSKQTHLLENMVSPLSELSYTRSSFMEAVRLNPIFDAVFRRIKVPIEVNGYYIPRGTLVQLPIGYLGMDQRCTPEPKNYHPERWNTLMKFGLDYEMGQDFIFGGGARACPCLNMCLMTAETVINEIVKRFRIETVEYEKKGKFGRMIKAKRIIFHDRDPMTIPKIRAA